jgi:CO dehydrogenase/acetyl-CoA synthase alpha subunit
VRAIAPAYPRVAVVTMLGTPAPANVTPRRGACDVDVDSIEALEAALERYDGTVVAVSHDRYFLDRIADRIVVVADGALNAYEGGWSVNAAVALPASAGSGSAASARR